MNECLKCKHVQSLQSCPTLCDAMDGSPPGSSIHGILQARILEYVSSFSSRGSSQSRVQTHLSYLLHCRWVCYQVDFPGGSDDKVSAYKAGDQGSIPRSGKSFGEGNGNPLQYSCLENPMDGGAWQAIVHGVSKSRTGLSDFTFTFFSFFTTSATWEACMNEEQLIISKVQLQGGGCW